jgi:hypothetical protein
LKAILKLTPKDHPDDSDVSKAGTMMTKLYQFIQQSLHHASNKANILEAQRKIQNNVVSESKRKNY